MKWCRDGHMPWNLRAVLRGLVLRFASVFWFDTPAESVNTDPGGVHSLCYNRELRNRLIDESSGYSLARVLDMPLRTHSLASGGCLSNGIFVSSSVTKRYPRSSRPLTSRATQLSGTTVVHRHLHWLFSSQIYAPSHYWGLQVYVSATKRSSGVQQRV